MNEREKLEQKIHDAPHMSKPDKADLVFYDGKGRHIFEVYAPQGYVKSKFTDKFTPEKT